MEAKHTSTGVIANLQKFCVLTGTIGICFIAYGGRHAFLSDLSGRTHTISQTQLQEDLDNIFRGCLFVTGSIIAGFVLKGLKSLNWSHIDASLPILNDLPPKIQFTDGFLDEIKKAKNVLEITEEITASPFISDDAKDSKSKEPVVFIPSGKRHMPYLLSSVQRYVRNSNDDSKEFKNFYGETILKGNVIVMERSAFNKHLQTVYEELHPIASSNTSPPSSPHGSGMRNRRNPTETSSSTTTDYTP
jgi:hypothetical protein